MEGNQVHIPEGWEKVDFKDYIFFQEGPGLTSSLFQERGFPFLNIRCIENGKINKESCQFISVNIANSIYKHFQLIENDLVVSTSGTLGKKAFIRKKDLPLLLNTSIIRFRPLDASKISLSFLNQLLEDYNFLFDLYSQSTGSAQVNVGPTHLKKLSIVIPKSVDEQFQIATILSKVDEAITQTEQLIAKYNRIKTGLMQDLLTKGIDENGNIRSEETHEFKDSPLGRIPKEWEYTDITKFTKDKDGAIKPGPFGSSVKKEYYSQKGYKIYGQEQVIANNPDIGNYFIDEKRFGSLRAFRVEAGDVLLSCVGTIGSVLIIPQEFKEGIINPRLIKFSIDPKKTNVFFFAEYLKHSSINIQLLNLATGGTMPVLNKKIVLSLRFVYPPIEEQNRINEKWRSITNYIEIEKSNLSKLQSLKTGLMQDLLSGKVRVKHLIKETASV